MIPRTFFAVIAASTTIFGLMFPSEVPAAEVRKLEDITIYSDPRFYSTFPSIVRRPDGELLVAFRRAPERRRLGEKGTLHVDPNSNLVLVRSADSGRTWTSDPQLIYAHPLGGSQDPCMVQLRDGTIICTSYAWAQVSTAALPILPQPNTVHYTKKFVFLGGYLMRTTDGAKSWGQPVFPPPAEGDDRVGVFGDPLPAYNRGAMCEGSDGRLYWMVVGRSAPSSPHGEVHLLISEDKGLTWKFSCRAAGAPNASFHETSLYETPKGDLVAFIRTTGLDDHLVVARSTDRGRSFLSWADAGFQGNPFFATRLPDQRVLLVYGYRHKPFGIRARVLNAECTDVATATEIVLRDDGGTADLGYPWATVLSADRALVVYYFNKSDGTRSIEGTILRLE